jgi:hypothetical protein
LKKDNDRLNDLESLKNVINMMFDNKNFKIKKTEDELTEAYNSIEGAIRMNSKAVGVKTSKLVVNVDNSSVSNLLAFKKSTLLKKIYEKTGNKSVTDIIFTIYKTGDNNNE